MAAIAVQMTTDSLSLLKAVRAIHLRNPDNHYFKNGTDEEITARTAALLPNRDDLETEEKAILTICLAAHRAFSGCTSPGESLAIQLLMRYAESGLTPLDIEIFAEEFNENFADVATIAEKHNIDFPPTLRRNVQQAPQSPELAR